MQQSTFNLLLYTPIPIYLNMSRITEELLRKRAEHNDCCLTTLEEVHHLLSRFLFTSKN